MRHELARSIAWASVKRTVLSSLLHRFDNAYLFVQISEALGITSKPKLFVEGLVSRTGKHATIKVFIFLLGEAVRQVDNYFYDAPDRPLYHYTGIGTLLGLAQEAAFWASHVNYLNDSKELVHACDMMQYVRLPAFAFGGAAKSAFLDQFGSWIDRFRTEPSNLFIFSMSEEQSLLSQWRSYTPHGKGVSIGLSTLIVTQLAEANTFRLGKCIYSLNAQCELIESLIEKLWITCEQHGIPNDNDIPDYSSFFERHRNDVLQVMALIKHEAFEEEREWRLISNFQFTHSQICFRPGEGASMLTPYIKLWLNEEAFPFDLVMLGPTPHKELALHALSAFVRKSELCRNVAASDIPYREW